MGEEVYCKGKNFTISLDSEKELVSIEVWGVHTREDAKEFNSVIFKLLKEVPENKRKKYCLIV